MSDIIEPASPETRARLKAQAEQPVSLDEWQRRLAIPLSAEEIEHTQASCAGSVAVTDSGRSVRLRSAHLHALDGTADRIDQIWVFSLRRSARRSMARPIRRAINSFCDTPDASHILGYMLMAVKPGMVLTSFT